MRKVISITLAVLGAALQISCSGGGGDDGTTQAEDQGYDATGTWLFTAVFQPSYDGQTDPIEGLWPTEGTEVDIEQTGDTFEATIFGTSMDGTVSGTEYAFVWEYPSDPAIPLTVDLTLTSATTATGTAQMTIANVIYTYALTGTKTESGSSVVTRTDDKLVKRASSEPDNEWSHD